MKQARERHEKFKARFFQSSLNSGVEGRN